MKYIMLVAVAILAVVLYARDSEANACLPENGEYFGFVYGNHLVGDRVPEGKAWVIRAAGVFTSDGNPIEWMMEISHPVWQQGNACCHLIPVARSPGYASGTPVLALTREVVLLGGEAITARANGVREGNYMGLTYLYWQVPASCITARAI